MGALVLYIRLHDGRYHGKGDWPPSPARLFQALIAGMGLSGPLRKDERCALSWLEKQKPPIVATPLGCRAKRGVLFYMPNNDSDAIGGDPLKNAKIRTATKTFRPYLFDPAIPFIFVWQLDEEEPSHAQQICSMAERLYQFGRGIDMAWGWGEIMEDAALERILSQYPGPLFRPSAGESILALPCPCQGSLESLERRHQAFDERFRYERKDSSVKVTFRRPPQPRFQQIPYNSPPSRQLYELRDPVSEAGFAPWSQTRVMILAIRLRNGAVVRLTNALPERAQEIERTLVGRKPGGANDSPPEDRVRIIPLPSIGHVHADREVRRLLVEVPPTCPLLADDIRWAFSGLDVIEQETGEILAVLLPNDDETFLRHYGFEKDRSYRTWRTVTPAVLPGFSRRRIDPTHRYKEAEDGQERRMEIERAAAAVCQALRHAGIRERVETIRVQREPFEGKGRRAEDFADGTRFAKERLWHVEIVFKHPIAAPLVIGDGRFLGLGLMAPVRGGMSRAQPTIAMTMAIDDGTPADE